MLATFVCATNCYGRRKFAKTNHLWKDLTIAELKAFLAVIWMLGLVKYPSREWVFSKTALGDAFAPRFHQILRSLHFEDRDTITGEEMAAEKRANAFWEIERFCCLLAKSFEKAFNPGQKLDIDEGCIPISNLLLVLCMDLLVRGPGIGKRTWYTDFRGFTSYVCRR